jgi:hypothetical protein
MGYTHYWTFKAPNKIQGRQIEIENKYQLAVRQCQRIVKAYNKTKKEEDPKHPDRLSGYSAHTKMNDYLGLEFNGTKELAHETFCLRDHWSKNEAFNFCKTASKPYDVVVVACLITLHHYLGDELLEVSSDGDASDWQDGLKLAKEVTKIKSLKVPDSIRVMSPAAELQLVGKTFN